MAALSGKILHFSSSKCYSFNVKALFVTPNSRVRSFNYDGARTRTNLDHLGDHFISAVVGHAMNQELISVRPHLVVVWYPALNCYFRR